MQEIHARSLYSEGVDAIVYFAVRPIRGGTTPFRELLATLPRRRAHLRPSLDLSRLAVGRRTRTVARQEALRAIYRSRNEATLEARGSAARLRGVLSGAAPTIKPSLGLAWSVRHFLAYKMPGAAKRFAKNDFAALEHIYARWSPAWTLDPCELEAARKCFSHRASLETRPRIPVVSNRSPFYVRWVTNQRGPQLI